ncbi:hypothetical protein [Streptomyces gilvosporeus]|uniref:hypothetical protein n=1 Tax=Streptomyces gilvosporeus TaxID=553510 RepID=UPI00131B2032|nr:hypothetical protein [Streptomyces gilvosporeus]
MPYPYPYVHRPSMDCAANDFRSGFLIDTLPRMSQEILRPIAGAARHPALLGNFATVI